MTKTFRERMSVNNVFLQGEFFRKVLLAHDALQHVEIPAKDRVKHSENLDKALFHFLDALGFYPGKVNLDGTRLKVTNWVLDPIDPIYGHPANFFATAQLEGGGSWSMPLLGPDAPHAANVSLQSIEDFLRALFPEIVIQTTTGMATTGEAVYHITVREAFMQDKDSAGDPMANGSAMNKNRVVALMQASTRMLREIALDSMCSTMFTLLPESIKDALATQIER